MKRIMSTIFTFTLVFLLCVPTFATEDIQKSKMLKLNSADNDVVISEVMSFDELVAEISKDSGVDKRDVEEEIFYSEMKDKKMDRSRNFFAKEMLVSSLRSSTFRTFSDRVDVNDNYRPSVKFYCQTSEGGGFLGIVKILNVGMNRKNNGMTKQFGGTIYTNLENAGTIYWSVDGNFYNNGTTTCSGGVNVGIDDFASVNFNVSHSTDFYDSCWDEGRIYVH